MNAICKFDWLMLLFLVKDVVILDFVVQSNYLCSAWGDVYCDAA